MMDEEYFSRIGIKYDFEGTTRTSCRLIFYFLIGITIQFLVRKKTKKYCIFGLSECAIAFINTTHILGFCLGLLLIILSGVGICFISKVQSKRNNRRCWCLKKDNFKESCSKLFYYVIFTLLIVLVFIMIILKSISISKNPNLTSFPPECERLESCSRVIISDKNHRDHLVNYNNLFTINHLGVNNTEDYIQACALDQGQSRLEYSTRNKYVFGSGSEENSNYLSKSHKVIAYYHINYSSTLWGLVDDMSIAIVYCHSVSELHYGYSLESEPSIGIEIQSEARIGEDDFESNPSRIADFYQCLSSKIDKAYISNRGSVCKR